MMNQFVFVPFTNNVQEEVFWCWAAVAANTFNSMLPPGSSNFKQQCDVVKLMKGNPLGEPCMNKAAYNEPDSVSNAFFALGVRDRLPAVPSFKALADELMGVAPNGSIQPGLQEPICAEVDFGRATHVVAISAADTGTQHVWIEDPWPGAGNTIEHTYSDFISNYSYKQGVGPSGGVVPSIQRVLKLAGQVVQVQPEQMPPEEEVLAERSGLPWFRSAVPPLQIPETLPNNVISAVQTGLPTFRSADGALQKLLLDVAEGKGGERLRVFTPGVPEVLQGGSGLSSVDKPAGWRIAAAAANIAIGGDVYDLTPPGASTPKLACVRTGPHIVRLLQGIAALEQPANASRVPAAPYAMNLLIMPDLFTEALWLRPEDPSQGPSVFFPYYTLIKDMPVMTAYSEGDLITLLRPIAEKWKSFPHY